MVEALEQNVEQNDGDHDTYEAAVQRRFEAAIEKRSTKYEILQQRKAKMNSEKG